MTILSRNPPSVHGQHQRGLALGVSRGRLGKRRKGLPYPVGIGPAGNVHHLVVIIHLGRLLPVDRCRWSKTVDAGDHSMSVAEARRYAFAIGGELIALDMDVSVFEGPEQPRIRQRVETRFLGILITRGGAGFVRKMNRTWKKAIVIVSIVGIQRPGKVLRSGRLEPIASC